jgi:hypothetical protein
VSTQPVSGIGSVPTLITQRLPRQPKQKRCRQFLAHSDARRTFYWIMESNGPTCEQCVDVRNTKLALAEQATGNSGKEPAAGKSGKPRRSTKAPAVKAAVILKRANGEHWSQISKDLQISKNTAKAIVEESEIDRQIENYRGQVIGLIPKAIAAMDTQLSKGDGSLGRQLLGDIGVIGKDAMGAKNSAVEGMQAMFKQCQVLINQAAPEPAPSPKEAITISAEVVNDNPAKDPDSHED